MTTKRPPDRNLKLVKNQGTTLIELLLTLSVVALLTLIATPLFNELLLKSRMTEQVNALVHSVFLAKHAAHMKRHDVVICPSIDGLLCERTTNWQAGWLVFANRSVEHPPQVDAGDAILNVKRPFENGSITSNRREFIFRPFEIRSSNGTVVFCDRRGAAHARALIVSYTGRPRLSTTRADGSALSCG